jgi:MtrB/PioB family decaheme-associated outer membrane protein
MNREPETKGEFMKRKGLSVLLFVLLSGLLLSSSVWSASSTTVHNIREGLHSKFTRLVLDSEGARPKRVGPASSDGIRVQFEKLNLRMNPKRLGRDKKSAVAKVSHVKERDKSVIFISFRHRNTEVKTFFLDADPKRKGSYRLVMDFYPQAGATKKGLVASSALVVSKKSTETDKKSGQVPSQDKSESENDESSESTDSEEEMSTEKPVLSGEIAIILRDTDVKGDAAKFEEYRDLSQPIIGELNIKYNKDDERFFEIDGENLAADDLYLHAGAGWFGKLRFDASYDKIPHRFADDAQTIYSGIGTNDMILPDALQANLEGAPFADVANRLNTFFNASAVSGDPGLSRDTGKLSMDLVNYDPLNFRAEFKREYRDGVLPSAGSFGLANNEGMSELLQPLDYETTDISLIGEYAKKSYLLNATYNFSMFESGYDTLSWDNPLRLNDIVGGPSHGLMDIAPSNKYHNLSLTGSLLQLPFKTRISAVAAWGLMSQDDALAPFTVNTAIAQPALPVSNVDVEVNTSLYNVTLTSRPSKLVNINGKFRMFEYDNTTEQILFPDGYVVTDSFISPSPVKNLPTSYKKTTAGANLGFTLSRKTKLNFGYTFEETDRTNREVANQKDNIISGSIDTNPFSWLDLRASYKRRDREVDGYDYTVPLDGGGANTQEPLLRKYDEADKVSDMFQFQTTLYPASSLAVNGTINYNEDDYENSKYGLLGSRYYSGSVDLDYAIFDRVNIHAFYMREDYEYLQKDRGMVGAVTADWLSGGQDVIDTFGGAINASLIEEKLDFDLSYTYSSVDGNIDFYTPAAATANFPVVDESDFQMLKMDLKYNFRKGLSLTLGYLWEKFDFDDFQNQGFTNIPTDLSDLYQGALLMGNLDKSYEGNVIYLKLSYRF